MLKTRTCVITINYKNADETAACLASLNESNAPVSVVVVDNTPNDPTLEKLEAENPNVTFIHATKNLGFGGGNNLGILWALDNTECEFIFILNNDAAVNPGTVAELEMALDKYQDAGIATPRIVFMEKPDVLWYGGGAISWLRGSAITPGLLGACDAPLAMQERNVSFASGCALMIRRELMIKLGGFDERFFMYEEDVELCLRTQQLGWNIRYIPNAVLSHKVQASSRGEQDFVGMFSPHNTNLSFYVYHSIRNRLINMRLYAKGVNKLIFSLGFSLFVLKKSLIYAYYRRWDGIAAIMRGWQSYKTCFTRASN